MIKPKIRKFRGMRDLARGLNFTSFEKTLFLRIYRKKTQKQRVNPRQFAAEK